MNEVAVVMPVFNGAMYLKRSIESILNQTFTKFTFYIINDGSSDNSENIILSYNDNRIKYITFKTNKGIVEVLNYALNNLKEKYLVRMDSDDIALKNRVETLYNKIKNSQHAVIGSGIYYFNDRKRLYLKKRKNVFEKHNDIFTQFLFYNGVSHPTVIINRELLSKNNLIYDVNHHYCEDYGLWVNVAEKMSIANIKKPLLKYRLNELGLSAKSKDNQSKKNHALHGIYNKMFLKLGIDLNYETFLIYLDFINLKQLSREKYFIILDLILRTHKEIVDNSSDIYSLESFKLTYSNILHFHYLRGFITKKMMISFLLAVEIKTSFLSQFKLLISRFIRRIL